MKSTPVLETKMPKFIENQQSGFIQHHFLKQKSGAGFSLLEVPITLFIIAVVLLIYGAASNSVVLNRNSRHQDLAHYIAVSEMEDVRSLGYAGVPATGPFNHSLLSQLTGAAATVTTSDYNADTKQVTVTITWTEPGAATTRTVSLTTLINKYGL